MLKEIEADLTLDYAEIGKLRANGLGVSAIATRLGCSRMQVYRVLAVAPIDSDQQT